MKSQKTFSASAYRQQIAEAVELPSGASFLLRKVSMQTYLRNGRLPENLFRKIFTKWQIIEKLSADMAGQEIAKDFSAQEIEQMLLFQADVVKTACVVPKIVVDADGSKDDELNPNELTEADYNFIFQWAITQGGEQAQSLEKFR